MTVDEYVAWCENPEVVSPSIHRGTWGEYRAGLEAKRAEIREIAPRVPDRLLSFHRDRELRLTFQIEGAAGWDPDGLVDPDIATLPILELLNSDGYLTRFRSIKLELGAELDGRLSDAAWCSGRKKEAES